MDLRMEKMDTKFDKKFDNVDNKLDKLGARFDGKFDHFQMQMFIAVSYTTFFYLRCLTTM
jgi:hypothetical protein